MKDVKLPSALNIDWSCFREIRNLNKDCFLPTAEVYATNMLRVRSAIELLPAFAGIVARYTQAAVTVAREWDHSPFDTTEKLPLLDQKRFLDQVEHLTNLEEKALQENYDFSVEHDKRQIRNVDFWLKLYSGDPLESGVKALMHSTIKNAWTSIEVLTEDLLITAQNHFPQCFQKLQWVGHEPKFSRRSGIKTAYEKAFPVDDDSIRRAVNSEGIDALALLRNVLVHKAGRVDKEFKVGANGNSLLATYKDFSLNQEIMIDGEVIKTVIEPAMKAGMDLIMAVDTWITMAVPNHASARY